MERLTGRFAARSGFTLIEALVALALVGTAVAGLLRLQVISVQTSTHASRLWTASLLAQEKMAEVMAADRIDEGSRQGATEDEPVYAWRVSVEPARAPGLADAEATSLKSVVVTVSWPDGRSERSLALVTYVSPKR